MPRAPPATVTPGPAVLGVRHSSRPWAGRSTDIRIECSAVYTLRYLFMARITSRDNKRFSMDPAIVAPRPSLPFRGTRRFVICLVAKVRGLWATRYPAGSFNYGKNYTALQSPKKREGRHSFRSRTSRLSVMGLPVGRHGLVSRRT